MAQAGKHARRFQEWTTQLPADVDATFALLGSEAVATPGRRFLAGALNYCLTQLDLIPDHEKAGAVDDAFVVRVAFGLAAEHAGKAGTKESALIARMTNDEDEIRQFAGDALFAKLRRYVVELADKPVRGRTTDQILSDEKARADMRRELDQSTKKLKPAIAVNDAEAEAIEVSVKSYLKMKLGG
jgi:uncharacterized membrane protein YkvA (DUF1232 family)